MVQGLRISRRTVQGEARFSEHYSWVSEHLLSEWALTERFLKNGLSVICVTKVNYMACGSKADIGEAFSFRSVLSKLKQRPMGRT